MMDIGLLKRGRHRKPVDSRLINRLLPMQLSNPEIDLYISDPKQYYWWLLCGQHIALLTTQGMDKRLKRQDKDPAANDCYRCANASYLVVGPQPASNDTKRVASYGMQQAWLALEAVLVTQDVAMRLLERAGTCAVGSLMHGKNMGYIVEAKVLQGTYGAADAFVPLLNLVVHVDGEHHAKNVDQVVKDDKFNAECTRQGRSAVRLYWSRELPTHYYQEITEAVERCFASEKPFILYSRNHPNRPLPPEIVTNNS